MKASIKFREEQKPLLRAKIPLNILSFPFQSGIVAGESKELSLNLSTFFDAGPIFKIAYRPNNSQNPFSLVCKTGIGHFGSPISSPFTMSAEFNFVGNQNPTFFIHFKPKFGDFSAKKSHSSSVLAKRTESKLNGSVSADEGSVVKSGYFEESGLFHRAGKIGVLPMETGAAAAAATGVMESFFSGTKVNARTALPLKNRAVVNFLWGLRFPPAAPADGAEDAVIVGKNERTTGISFRRFPMLLMDKISIEHVPTKDSKAGAGSGSTLAGSSDVAEVCLNMKKQLEIIQAENGLLRKALDDMSIGLIVCFIENSDGNQRTESKGKFSLVILQLGNLIAGEQQNLELNRNLEKEVRQRQRQQQHWNLELCCGMVEKLVYLLMAVETFCPVFL
ncbi:hypothetical protein M9H77_11928 [Catharanthus roseus]|uniref:Uncharacterized protein n=1 Tax=Catharanthus roseus TaxID=4058 RepID=A0ACC0BG01_CATRO|nr:hypothetical protein M9H77_11928 [Catharanthus roseus]